MSREIKYRVYRPLEKSMQDVTMLTWSKGKLDCISTSESDLNPDKVELMQFTGLTDKNGKEIYEGDLLHSTQWNPDHYEVIFREGEFVLWHNVLDYYDVPIHHCDNFKVIGNVFENPGWSMKESQLKRGLTL